MNEKALSQELHRVAKAIPVPDDLYSPELLQRRPHQSTQTRSRSRWIGAAVAAAALLVFLVSPLGAKVVTAAGELITQLAVKVIKVENPAEMAPYIDTSTVQPGQTVVQEKPGYPKQVATGLTLKELEPGWPIPTYKAPGPDAPAVRVITYQKDSDLPMAETVSVRWWDDGRPVFLSISRRTEPIAEEELRKAQDPDSKFVTIYTSDQQAKVQRKTVQLKGQNATATRVGTHWALHWAHAYGAGSIFGKVELDELVKIAESLPDLK